VDKQNFHTFLVPAYNKSPYLIECLKSLAEQEYNSKIIISTSTPFEGLDVLSRQYGAELYIHGPNLGMSHDWNTGLAQITTPWVTIAHQDDIYDACFTKTLFDAVEGSKMPLVMVFSNYRELIGIDCRINTPLLRLKRLLLQFGFLGRSEIYSNFSKINCLRFGCPIPCPSVSLNLSLHSIKFSSRYMVNMDWDAWIVLAKRPGGFYWIRDFLMSHRLHLNSETSLGLSGGYRAIEDACLLRKLWPNSIAALISKLYFLAYNSNKGQ
jgi:glycosyltransferase involved in cell wall biosynthesis